MKNIRLALIACALTLISFGAMAQSVYVVGGVGFGNVDACEGVSNCDSSNTALKLVGGYEFGRGFAVELGYIDFGTAHVSSGSLTADFKVKAPTFGVAYTAPLSNAVGLNLRLGVANLKSNISVSVAGLGGASDSETKSAPYYGIGIQFAVAQNVRLVAAADFSRAEYHGEKADVRAITVGVRVDF
jgi:OOP family OmpA-OmpF porin